MESATTGSGPTTDTGRQLLAALISAFVASPTDSGAMPNNFGSGTGWNEATRQEVWHTKASEWRSPHGLPHSSQIPSLLQCIAPEERESYTNIMRYFAEQHIESMNVPVDTFAVGVRIFLAYMRGLVDITDQAESPVPVEAPQLVREALPRSPSNDAFSGDAGTGSLVNGSIASNDSLASANLSDPRVIVTPQTRAGQAGYPGRLGSSTSTSDGASLGPSLSPEQFGGVTSPPGSMTSQQPPQPQTAANVQLQNAHHRFVRSTGYRIDLAIVESVKTARVLCDAPTFISKECTMSTNYTQDEMKSLLHRDHVLRTLHFNTLFVAPQFFLKKLIDPFYGDAPLTSILQMAWDMAHRLTWATIYGDQHAAIIAGCALWLAAERHGVTFDDANASVPCREEVLAFKAAMSEAQPTR